MPALALALAAVGASGCLLKAPKENLRSVVLAFNSAQRWGLADRMAEHVPADGEAGVMAKRDDFGELQVTSCEVGALELKKKGHAVAMVKIEWYRLRRGRLNTTFVSQRWKQVDGVWKMIQQRRVRGAPYPLLRRDRRGLEREVWPEVSAR